MHAKQKMFYTVLKLSLLLVAAASFLEVSSRIILKNSVTGFVLGTKIELPSNIDLYFKNPVSGSKLDETIHLQRNSMGFRGVEPPFSLDEYLSIITVGGSTTECILLSEGDTWTDGLQNRLSGVFNQLWVNNAGLEGHSTFGHLLFLDNYLLSIKPDIFIFLVGINDVGRQNPVWMDDISYWSKAIEKAEFVKNKIADRSVFLSYIANLKRHKKAIDAGLFMDEEVNFANLKYNTLSPEEMSGLLSSHETYLPGYKERLLKIVDKSLEAGVEPIFVTQPAVYGYGIDPTTGVDLSKIVLPNINGIEGGPNGLVRWSILELYNDVTREVATEKGVFLVDLANKMPKDTKFYYDYVHFTKLGANEVARILYEDLCPHIRTKFGNNLVKSC